MHQNQRYGEGHHSHQKRRSKAVGSRSDRSGRYADDGNDYRSETEGLDALASVFGRVGGRVRPGSPGRERGDHPEQP